MKNKTATPEGAAIKRKSISKGTKFIINLIINLFIYGLVIIWAMDIIITILNYKL